MTATEQTDYALAKGDVVGIWRVVRSLGRGGMAEVYEVEDTRLGSRYALNLFTYRRGQEEVARAQFFAEGRLLAKLDHPRIVRVYEIAEDPATGRPYFVMDLVLDGDGKSRTLADSSADGVEEEQVARWYEDLREGLAYIHGKGVLHRDLKLQNILVGPDGHVVISDFGVAKIFSTELRADLGLSAEQTLIAVKGGKQTVMGSMGYMAPELEMGVAASKESDWYALGVVIFHLLTGVWCDSRTDVVGDLETYNPLWREIVPKLLHANPVGRACPSWIELDRERREREAYRAEKIYGEARDKLRRAKRSKKYLATTLAAFVAAALVSVLGMATWRHFYYLPPFEDLCAIPANAPRETDEEGVITRTEYEQAQVDVWYLTHDILADVRRGKISRKSAAVILRNYALRASQEDDTIFHEDYQTQGDGEVQARLLIHMADIMEGNDKK